MGINSNVVVDGVTFHVQSEDLGPRVPQLITHVFREGGTVVKVAKLDYSNHLTKPNLNTVLSRVMKAHHVKVLRKLQRGRMDSIPPSVIMRPTTEEEDARLFTEPSIPNNPLPELPSQVHVSIPSTTDEPGSDRPPDSAALIWERVVAEAQQTRQLEPVSRRHEKPAPTATDWDRIVESRRHGRLEVELKTASTPEAVPDAATDAYQKGVTAMRRNDAFEALMYLAKAVQLEPTNRRFRAALRRALDFADEQE
jgi:hypothetical protein